jgi:hypothetical protein
MVQAVRTAIEDRWLLADKPTEGWVFQSADSEVGHVVTVKGYHACTNP